MGLAVEIVRFAGALPSLEAIRDQVARRTGLAVGLTVRDEEYGTLSFACEPGPVVEVRRRRRTQPLGKIEHHVASPDTIKVSAGLQEEPTLFLHTCEALHDLGGKTASGPLPPDDPLLRPVTEGELRKRVRKARRQARIGAAILIAAHALVAPLYLAAFALALVIIIPAVLLGGLYRELFGDPRPGVRR
jgi:hypothetical protein